MREDGRCMEMELMGSGVEMERMESGDGGHVDDAFGFECSAQRFYLTDVPSLFP